jgi:hypothetical protein
VVRRAAIAAAMSDQQVDFLENLVDVSKVQSDTLMGAAQEVAETLEVQKYERELWEKMKDSKERLGEKNDTVKDFFAEMGRTLLDDMERPLEDLDAALQRVQVLTRYFSEYSGSLLPTGHENQWGKGKDDSRRLIESYRLARERAEQARAEVLEAAVEETNASQNVDRLERQNKIDAGPSGGDADGGDGAADEKAQKKLDEKKRAQEERIKEAKRSLENWKKDYQARKEALSDARELEATVCEHLEKQMAQFEWDRAEFMQLALGDLFYSGVAYHSQAMVKHAKLYREVVEMVPDNIESDTHLVKSRQVQAEAKLTMENIEKKAADAKEAERQAAGGKGAASGKPAPAPKAR